MKPDIEKAASKAIKAANDFGVDPLTALSRIRNVLLLPYEITGFGLPMQSNQDAFTLVNNADGILQFIVIYNKKLPEYKTSIVLARELGHVIMQHDGNIPEEIWQEEALCFAYHYIATLSMLQTKKIYFRPLQHCLSWEMKAMITFDSVESMKRFVADERNKFCRFIGKSATFSIDDVELMNTVDFERQTGWKNCFDIAIDGQTVGHCGE